MKKAFLLVGFLCLCTISVFSQYSFPGIEAETVSKQVLLQQLKNWQISKNPGYPRLYFNSETIKSVRKQYLARDSRILKLVSECDSLVARPIPDYSNFDLSRYKARNEAEKLSFAYAITQNDKYSTYARDLVQQMTQWPDWVYEEHKPRRVDLGVAGVAYILALCYDWLYPTLTAREKMKIKNAIFEKALVPFYEVYSTKSEGWTHAEHNWRSVICGEMGVVTLTFLEKIPNAKENLRFAIDGVVDVLAHGGIDGGWNEGVSYWGYGIGQAIMFVEALYRVSDGKVNLYDLPFLKNTGDFGLYCRTPEGGSFNFSDCNPGPPLPWLMAILASHYQNFYWQWSAQKDIGNSIPDILFYNTALPATPPENTALGKHFHGIQIATMRSSWDKNALFVGLKTGQTTVNHSHLDLNSFVVHAFGKPLLIDLFVWPYAHYLGFFEIESKRWDFEGNHTIGHNTLLVNGQGQRHGEKHNGRIINFSSRPNLQFAVGEANSAYGDVLNKFHRYITMVDGKMVVVVDEVKANGSQQLEWLMHYDKNISKNEDGTFTVSNNKTRLDVQFMRPSQLDNRIVNFESHETTYTATRETTQQTNNFVSIQPLHKQKDYRFIVALFPYQEQTKPVYSAKVIKESVDDLIVKIELYNDVYELLYDFKHHTVEQIN